MQQTIHGWLQEGSAWRLKASEWDSRLQSRFAIFTDMNDWSHRPPAAVFDLHGQSVLEAAMNAEKFLEAQARARRGATVRLITGRGASGGAAPIRGRVRSLLRRLKEEGRVVRDFVLEDTKGSFLIRLRD